MLWQWVSQAPAGAPGLIIVDGSWRKLVTTLGRRPFESPPGERPVSALLRDEEQDLVERAKRDPRQFGALYDRHFQQIYRFVDFRVREQTAGAGANSHT